MALVCDIKSNTSQEDTEKIDEEDLEDGEIEDDEEDPAEQPAEIPPVEISIPAPIIKQLPPPSPPERPPPFCGPPLTSPEIVVPEKEKDKDKKRDRSERSEKRRHDEKGKKHMTEAEKSILHLRKREEMQRKKWEKMRSKETLIESIDDDFAKNIEKTLATILNKKEKEAAALAAPVAGEEGFKEEIHKSEDKKSRKRRRNERDGRKNKQRKLDSPKSEIDENEMLNMRGGSPKMEERMEGAAHSVHSEESYESEYSSDPNRIEQMEEREREDNTAKRKKKKKNSHSGRDKKNKSKDRKKEQTPLQDSKGVCVFYLQGKCQKNDCPYSHEAIPPMKLELCKFYLMDCCAKGLNCSQGDDCKFAHGKQLSESLKQILFKHIETAPREILGGFPRMNREEALNMINITQGKLQDQAQGVENKPEVKGGIPSLFDINVPVPPELLQGCDDIKNKLDKANRNRPSRWQDPDPIADREFPLKPFNYGQDQDMRINSNGDVDMRTLPPSLANITTSNLPISSSIIENQDIDFERYTREAGILQMPKQDVDIRSSNLLSFPSATKDIDIRQQPLLATKDIDIRQIPLVFNHPISSASLDNDTEDELQIDTGDDKKEETSHMPVDLPKAQRDLFLRIQANQKDNVVEAQSKEGYEMDENINWYSDDDDDDDNRLTIKVDNEDTKDNKEEVLEPSKEINDFLTNPPAIKPQDVVEKLGDLSKIDISAEVTKLLTSMSQGHAQFPFTKGPTTPPEIKPVVTAPVKVVTDPRMSARQDPRVNSEKASDSPRSDPRLTVDPRHRPRQSSTESIIKPEKLSIYEQGSINKNAPTFDDDIDLRVTGFKPDVDLRNLQLPFKGIQNYTPASEIDASVNSHPPITWKLNVVEIPRPDYNGLKLSINDAEKTGDPRLRKIFRLSTEERDTPMSPKASPKATPTVRVDPRLRKMEEQKPDPISAAMSYNQQVTMLRSSAFYQSLTSQQKVLLNHELSVRNDANTNNHDPVLNSLLSNLDIIPGANLQANHSLNAALSILTNASPVMNMVGQNPAMGPMGGAMNMTQPGLLGAAPGIPNMPNDFPMNFDPRNGGLLGNAPMPFGGFPPPQESQGNFPPYNDDYYPPDNPGPGAFQGGNRDNRGYNRERRRGRSNFHNRHNSGNRNFRNNRNNNNRSNRTHSPP
ncbi:unnamed protein product [Psylliodes chrysocephalus]|uniref:C3H1-type domain-containing protein n=1 Tax=Psylliodes chrysocephalus TaxID=3402493 RepID=A0A9P0D0R7_9CUCU|nr:unnamed protein product [Psylliodes chrysocephala]